MKAENQFGALLEIKESNDTRESEMAVTLY